MATINEKDVQHLANLANLELTPGEIEKYTADLARILDHFGELREVNTDSVVPMAGGTFLKNIFRDEANYDRSDYREIRDRIVEAFPEKVDDALRVPSVFNAVVIPDPRLAGDASRVGDPGSRA